MICSENRVPSKPRKVLDVGEKERSEKWVNGSHLL